MCVCGSARPTSRWEDLLEPPRPWRSQLGSKPPEESHDRWVPGMTHRLNCVSRSRKVASGRFCFLFLFLSSETVRDTRRLSVILASADACDTTCPVVRGTASGGNSQSSIRISDETRRDESPLRARHPRLPSLFSRLPFSSKR